MTQDEEIRRGHEAARLMAEPLLQEAFANIDAGIVGAMKQAAAGNKDTHHELVLMLQLAGRVKGFFKESMETGRLARTQKETLLERAKAKLRRAR